MLHTRFFLYFVVEFYLASFIPLLQLSIAYKIVENGLKIKLNKSRIDRECIS